VNFDALTASATVQFLLGRKKQFWVESMAAMAITWKVGDDIDELYFQKLTSREHCSLIDSMSIRASGGSTGKSAIFEPKEVSFPPAENL
jgi:hypothetical protein